MDNAAAQAANSSSDFVSAHAHRRRKPNGIADINDQVRKLYKYAGRTVFVLGVKRMR